AALFLALVGGHPESAFHSAAVAGVWFLVEVRPGRPRAFATAAGAGLFAFALAAPAVLPILEALPQSVEARQRISAPAGKTSQAPAEAFRSAAGAVCPDAYGGWLASSSPSAPSFDSATAASIGGVGLSLAAFALLSWRREKWPLAGLSLLTLAVAVGFPGFADVVNRLPVFRLALNNRLASATAFLLAALSAIGLEQLAAASWRRAILLPAGAGAAVIAAVWRHATLVSRHVDPARFDRAAAFAVGGILLVFAAWSAAGPRPAIFAPAALAIFLVVRVAAMPRLSPTFSARDFYPPIPELGRLPRGDAPWRIAGLGNALQPNQSALYGIEDARGYEGLNNARLTETFPLWSVPQRLWFNRVDDPSRPFLRFLNARFLAADPGAPAPPGWSLFARGASLSIDENASALPRAFAPRRIRFTGGAAASIDEMERCADFSDLAWIEDPGEPTREIENGRADLRVREDGPDLLIDVDAAAPAWIVASETNWKGWRARENNTRFDIRFANHAFLGFRVPAGRHRIRLEYRPSSFRFGAALAGLAILTAAAVGIRNRLSSAAIGAD
ncbi:MAG TPA: YfhO family protein, partial [Thermoanaerobaculia bacterium]|nr:YfhO family protein [Thermoanaerobaculia bacterium]